MPRDIRRFGAGEGVGFYWIRFHDTGGPYLELAAIDEFGEVTQTGVRAEWDGAAPDRQEAVLEHLSGAVSEADAKLERRRAKAPEQPPAAREIADEATRRFMESA